jgi:hypothetical protein
MRWRPPGAAKRKAQPRKGPSPVLVSEHSESALLGHQRVMALDLRIVDTGVLEAHATALVRRALLDIAVRYHKAPCLPGSCASEWGEGGNSREGTYPAATGCGVMMPRNFSLLSALRCASAIFSGSWSELFFTKAARVSNSAAPRWLTGMAEVARSSLL